MSQFTNFRDSITKGLGLDTGNNIAKTLGTTARDLIGPSKTVSQPATVDIAGGGTTVVPSVEMQKPLMYVLGGLVLLFIILKGKK